MRLDRALGDQTITRHTQLELNDRQRGLASAIVSALADPKTQPEAVARLGARLVIVSSQLPGDGPGS